MCEFTPSTHVPWKEHVTPIQSSISKKYTTGAVNATTFSFTTSHLHLSLQNRVTPLRTLSDMVGVSSYFGQCGIYYSTTLIVIDQTILMKAFHICLFSADHSRIVVRIISIVY